MPFTAFLVLFVVALGCAAHASFNRLAWWQIAVAGFLPLLVAFAFALTESSYTRDEAMMTLGISGMVLCLGGQALGVSVGRKLIGIPPA